MLHTADRTSATGSAGSTSRTEDLRRVERRRLLQSENIDVLLVAGDLFSELAPPDGLRETIRHWRKSSTASSKAAAPSSHSPATTITKIFADARQRDDTRVADGGQAGRSSSARPVVPRGGTRSSLRLEGRMGGFPVQFVLMPCPRRTASSRVKSSLKYGSPDEKNKLLVSAWADAAGTFASTRSTIGKRRRRARRCDPHPRFARRAERLFRIGRRRMLSWKATEFPQQFDYIAARRTSTNRSGSASSNMRCSAASRRWTWANRPT